MAGVDVALRQRSHHAEGASVLYLWASQNAGTYVYEPGVTVQQALAMAGGLTDRGSDRRIRDAP